MRVKRLYTDEERRKWRATIPWTDAEIAAAIREAGANEPPYVAGKREKLAAYFERSGHLSKWILVIALPYLVRKCFCCGKPALYRKGVWGMCRVHRDESPESFRAAAAARDARQLYVQRVLNDRDRVLRKKDAERIFHHYQKGKA